MCCTLTLQGVLAEHGAFIRRTLAQIGVAAADLPDVEQEVRRGIASGLATFAPALAIDPARALRGWLFGIYNHQTTNHHKRRRRTEPLGDHDPADPTPTAEQQLVDEGRRALAEELLNGLAPERRAVVVLYDINGEPMVEVARALGVPLFTAWNRRRLAFADMRAAWLRLRARRR